MVLIKSSSLSSIRCILPNEKTSQLKLTTLANAGLVRMKRSFCCSVVV